MTTHDQVRNTSTWGASPALARRWARRICDDLNLAVGQRRFWLHLAAQDLSRRYARSVLGPFWVTLTMSLQIVALNYLVSGLFGAPLSITAPWITVGVIVWTFITSVMNESTHTLLENKNYLLEARTSIVGFVLTLVMRNLMISMHHLVILAVLIVAFRMWPGPSWFYLLAGVPLLVVAVAGLGLSIAILTPRFRDLGPLIASIMLIGFFLTPVLWRPESLLDNKFIATYNPFTHLIAIVRSPIMGEAPSALSWQVSVVTAIAALLFGLLMLALFRRRVLFWI